MGYEGYLMDALRVMFSNGKNEKQNNWDYWGEKLQVLV